MVLNAIAEREAARKKIAAELVSLDRQAQVARDFDQGAEERRLREELKTWRDVLEHSPQRGRTALREMLHGPIQAKWFPETDAWSFYGVATFGGVLHRIYSVGLTQEELDEYNRMSTLLNAAAALGPVAFRRVFADSLSVAEMEEVLGSASHAGSADAPSTSGVQRPVCPRGDSNTRHAV